MNSANERAWQRLESSGVVVTPGDEVFESARTRYETALSARVTEDARGGQTRSRRRAWALVAAAALAVPAVGVGAWTLGPEDSGPTARGHAPTTSTAPTTPGTSDGPAAPPKANEDTLVINGGNANTSQVAYFGLPDFQGFTESDYVADVVEGVIRGVSSEYVNHGDDGSVISTLSVEVQRSRHMTPGTIVNLYEAGGVVPKSAMAEDLAQKFGPLSPEDLLGYVEERFNDQPAARVGDHVLLAVGASFVKPEQSVVARLTADPDGTYEWVGKPPNPSWSTALTPDEVDALLDRP